MTTESPESRYRNYQDTLAEYRQAHLLRFWDTLSAPQREQLLNDLDRVDFATITPLLDPYVRNRPSLDVPSDVQPAEILPAPADAGDTPRYQSATSAGGDAVASGKVAAFVVAGGQGTRLGFDGPKGAYKISPIRQAPLFQLFAEYLLGVQRKYGKCPPWYIMTSLVNHEETVSFFESNQYFGLAQDNVRFFTQGQMPAFHPDGRIMLSEKHRVALSPDGHGGSLTALARSGALAEMRERGIEHISYFQVDNPLVKPIDPLFVGLHLETGSEMSSKALPKAEDKERVGNFCKVDGKVTVIEYSDLPDELAVARNADGSRKFDAGSIAIHLLTRSFVERLTGDSGHVALPWHRADKKVPFVDEHGAVQKPSEPNAVKLEMFVFDALPLAENPMVIYTDRAEEFSPVKNAEGVDSAVTSLRDMCRRAARWLEQSGVTVPKRGDGEPDCTIEINPAYALDAADLKQRLAAIPEIQSGATLLLTEGGITG
jgi:UDP-N-acetylglucosamine/UDP-N-acetylgalactosamine diphosphorylase